VAALNILFTDRALIEMREILGFIAQENLDVASALAGHEVSGEQVQVPKIRTANSRGSRTFCS